ncbi:hypothetical protein ACHAQJ_000254 [Trichoderma viride]
MGDLTAPPDSGTGSVNPILPEPTTKDPVVPQNQDNEQTMSGHDDHQVLQSNLAISQHASSPRPASTPSSTFYNHHGSYNMAPLANALPLNNYHHGQYQGGAPPRYPAGPSPPMASHMPQIPQYTGPSPMNMAPQGYYVPQTHHISPYYGGGNLPVNQLNTPMLQRQNMAYYPNPMAMAHPHTQYYYPQPAQYPMQISNVQSVSAPSQHPRTRIVQPASTGSMAHSQPVDGSQSSFPSQKSTQLNLEEQRSSARGSSRKPRQTGNAVWIGNLPPQTDLMSLVRHVSKETAGLESLFLIAKSNCAFANFKDEASCITAQLKLHESRFQSVRLVSRLRKNEVDGTTGLSAPTGPASTNKSGEYFGYARMASEFSPSLDSSKKIAPAPRPTTEVDLPKEVLTDATEYLPKGSIIDDPTRGTVFWEIYHEDSEKAPDTESSDFDGKYVALNEEEEDRSWGKPFRVEWLSTSRLPFHRIRGLRNPWNSNREVKIARDGTEIEPSVGQRLIGLFNNAHGAGSSAAARPPAGAMARHQQMGLDTQ